MAKIVHILAGPNGSGKSTLYKAKFSDLAFINPDLIERELIGYEGNAQIQAARLTLAAIEQYFQQDQDFVVETTLTGNVERRIFDQARAKGWEIHLHFVCLESADTNIRRVEERFRRGGHFIPAEVVSRRYERSLDNLPKVLPKADFAWLYDNSSRTGFDLIARFQQDAVLFRADTLPAWAKAVLG